MSHKGHAIAKGAALQRPTLLLQPKDNDKANAQYFFDDAAVQTVCSLFEGNGMQHVLCIGGKPFLSPVIFCRLSSFAFLSGSLGSVTRTSSAPRVFYVRDRTCMCARNG